MTPEQIDRVFGRGRLKMMTGEHVEVYREAVGPGERRRYTKRFLDTGEGDFGQWTEREWRILARLIGHGIRCVPDVVQFDGGARGGVRLVQTYDAGVTVDQWATLLPVARDGVVRRHVFEDCAHWWALAHHCLCALDEIHRLSLVHLDVKGDNICIPFGPANFDPDAPDVRVYPIFPRLALIDFAFSLVSRETLAAPLPIGWQKDYDYQSPRLLAALEAGRAGDIEPTQELDWRCDFYSLAAMLKRYLPDEDVAHAPDAPGGWSRERYADAKALIFRIRDSHDRNFPQWRPHQELAGVTGAKLREADLAASLDYGWTLARDSAIDDVAVAHTPLTRIAPSVATPQRSPIATRIVTSTAVTVIAAPSAVRAKRRPRVAHAVAASMLALVAFAAPSQFGDALRALSDDARALADAIRSRIEPKAADQPAVAQAPAETSATQANPQPPAEPAHEPSAATASEATAPAQSAEPPAVASAPTKAARTHAAPRTQLAQAATPRPKYPMPQASAPSKSHAKPATPPVHVARGSHATPVPASKVAPASPVRMANATPPAATPSQATPSAATAPEPSPVIALAAPSVSTPEPIAAPAAAPITAPAAPIPPATSVESTPSRAPASEAAPIAIAPAPKPATAPPRVASSPPPRQNDLRTQLSTLWRALRGRDQPPAPVEERSSQPPAALANAAPRTAPPPSPPVVSTAPSWTSAARAAPPMRIEPAPSVAVDTPTEEFSALAHRLLAESVPRVAAQAHSDLARVLSTAALAPDASQESGIVEAARNSWVSERMPIATSMAQPTYARRLLDEARHTYASGGGVAAAIATQTRAFGANPADADVASYLAFLYLRSSPPQAEAARELSLYAIAIRGSRRAAHVDDWHTFAIASALVGRDADARNSFFIASALGRNADRSCRTALSAYANYGERLRAPAEALIYRVHAQGRSWDSPYCTWPPDWSAVARWP